MDHFKGGGSVGERVVSRDGWHWKLLVSRRELHSEGVRMRNCLSNIVPTDAPFAFDLQGEAYWSLRDPEGNSVVTARVEYGAITEFLRAGNDPAEPEDLLHVPALRAFYRGIGVDLSPDMVVITISKNGQTLYIDGHEVHARDVEHHDETGLVRVEHLTHDETAEREARRVRAAEEDRYRIGRGQVLMQFLDPETMRALGPLRPMGEADEVSIVTTGVDNAAGIRVPVRRLGGREMIERYAETFVEMGQQVANALNDCFAQFVQAFNGGEISGLAEAVRPPTRAEREAARPHWQRLNERHQRRVR